MPEGDSARSPLFTVVDRVLQHPWMTGIGAIAAVLAIAFMVWPIDGQADNSKKVVDSTGGDCSAIGQAAQAICVNPPQPEAKAERIIGDVAVSRAPSDVYLFDGPPDRLPIPPDLPPCQDPDCKDSWMSWLGKTSDTYAVYPKLYVGLVSGRNDQVSLISITPRIFQRDPLKKPFTLISTPWESTLMEIQGSWIDVNVTTGKTWLEHSQMPPAALVSSGAGYESAKITISSRPKLLYKGQLQVTALINGEERTIDIGSRAHPLQWIREVPSKASGYSYRYWDEDADAWIVGRGRLDG